MGTIREIKVIGLDYELSAYVDQEDYQTLDLGSYNWTPFIGHSTTYAKTYNKGKTILLHRLIMGLLDAPRSVYVDHIDHNGLNNSRDNLRVTDNKGNSHNARKRLSAKNTSNYKGVSFDPNNKTNPWRSHITLSEDRTIGTDKKWRSRPRYLGCYRTEEEAALSYNKAAIEYFGDMAYLNIIEPIKA